MLLRHRSLSILLALGVSLVLAAPLAAQTNHAVSMIGTAFSPPTLTITAGDMVTWTNQSPLGHTSTSGSNCSANGLWNSGLLGTGQSFTFTFSTPGTYPYFCIPHCLCCAMVGEVTVLPPPSDCVLNCPFGDGGVISANGPASHSPDLDGDAQVALTDLSLFAQSFPPNPFDVCVDYDCDGVIGLVDLATFALHFSHAGGTPGVCQ